MFVQPTFCGNFQTINPTTYCSLPTCKGLPAISLSTNPRVCDGPIVPISPCRKRAEGRQDSSSNRRRRDILPRKSGQLSRPLERVREGYGELHFVPVVCRPRRHASACIVRDNSLNIRSLAYRRYSYRMPLTVCLSTTPLSASSRLRQGKVRHESQLNLLESLRCKAQ